MRTPPVAGELLVAYKIADGQDDLPAGWTVVVRGSLVQKEHGEWHAHDGEPIWIEPGQPDWPWRPGQRGGARPMDRDDDLPHYPSRDGAAYGCALIGLIAISFWAGVGLTLVGVNLGPGWAIAGAGVILILVALVVAAAGES